MSEEAKEFLRYAGSLFELADPEVYPQVFAYQLKLAQYEKHIALQNEKTNTTPSTPETP